MSTTKLEHLIGLLAGEVNDADRAAEADEQHWTSLGIDQDTEEAEESGRLIGYRQGLERALELARAEARR
jgi:hypothetical protein